MDKQQQYLQEKQHQQTEKQQAFTRMVEELCQSQFNGSLVVTFHQGELRMVEANIKGNSEQQFMELTDYTSRIQQYLKERDTY